jgi:S1-C subfamily serine protease
MRIATRRLGLAAMVLVALVSLLALPGKPQAEGQQDREPLNLEHLQRLQAERTAFAKALTPAVVAVAASKPDLAGLAQQQGMAASAARAASGFVVDGSYVVTCMDAAPNTKRVRGTDRTQIYLEPGDRVWLMSHDGTEFAGEVVGRDRRNLLVVIRMDDGHPDLPSLRLGDSDAVAMGTTTVGLGNTLDSMLIDRTVCYSYGTISGSYRFEPVDVLRGDDPNTRGDPYRGNVLETDVAVHNGDHGGPLVNLRGEVIGMLTGHFMAGRHLGCAVPSNQIRAVLPQLQRGVPEDDLARGWLGFSARTPADDPRIFVSRVDEDGPAAEAGIKEGWQLVRVDNYRIPNWDRLREMLGVTAMKRTIRTPGRGMFQAARESRVFTSYGVPVGTHIQLTLRNPETGEEKTVNLQVGEQPEDF